MGDINTSLLTMQDVCKRVKLSRAQIYALMKRGDFAPLVRLSPSRIAWMEYDIANWLYSRREGV